MTAEEGLGERRDKEKREWRKEGKGSAGYWKHSGSLLHLLERNRPHKTYHHKNKCQQKKKKNPRYSSTTLQTGGKATWINTFESVTFDPQILSLGTARDPQDRGGQCVRFVQKESKGHWDWPATMTSVLSYRSPPALSCFSLIYRENCPGVIKPLFKTQDLWRVVF